MLWKLGKKMFYLDLKSEQAVTNNQSNDNASCYYLWYTTLMIQIEPVTV